MHISYQNIIKYARSNKKISLRELAERTFLSFQGLSKYEAGLVNISTESFKLLANVLEIDISSFYYINNELEDDLNDLNDENEDEIVEELHEDRVERVEHHPLGEVVENQNDAEACQHLHRAGAADEQQHTVHDHADEKDVDEIVPANNLPYVGQELHHGKVKTPSLSFRIISCNC